MSRRTKKVIGWVITIAFSIGVFFGLRQIFPGYDFFVAIAIGNFVALVYILKERAYLQGVHDGAARVNEEVEARLLEAIEKNKETIKRSGERPVPFPVTKLNKVNGRGRPFHSTAS